MSEDRYKGLAELVSASSKVADWFEAQATRDEKAAKRSEFLSLQEAWSADAKNFRAMARDLRKAIAKALGQEVSA